MARESALTPETSGKLRGTIETTDPCRDMEMSVPVGGAVLCQVTNSARCNGNSISGDHQNNSVIDAASKTLTLSTSNINSPVA
jgi:hypothetical protein